MRDIALQAVKCQNGQASPGASGDPCRRPAPALLTLDLGPRCALRHNRNATRRFSYSLCRPTATGLRCRIKQPIPQCEASSGCQWSDVMGLSVPSGGREDLGHPASARARLPLAVTRPLPARRMPLAAARPASPRDNASLPGRGEHSPAADVGVVAVRSGTRYHPVGELVTLEYDV